MSPTGLDKSAVDAFHRNGEELRGHMEATLGATQRSVDAAISPAVWGGQASTAFGDVTARYNAASIKLNRKMQELMESVKAGAAKIEANDESVGQGVKSVANFDFH